ncbi:MAG: hypothetical protein IJD67_05970, partial [Clostridia bacterium]|nr:hypothetical protein [Clostridia bacterium]
MKRFISLLVAILMIVTAVPFTVSAAEVKTVYGGESLAALTARTSDFGFELKEDTYKYVRYTASAGTYNNSNCILRFTPSEVSLYDYPYVAIGYRTNARASADIAMYVGGKESWLSKEGRVKTERDDKWHSLVVNMNNMTGGNGVATASVPVTLSIKPFGAHEKTLTDGTYVEIKYIACFKTEEEAKSFEYKGEGTPATGEASIMKAPEPTGKKEETAAPAASALESG